MKYLFTWLINYVSFKHHDKDFSRCPFGHVIYTNYFNLNKFQIINFSTNKSMYKVTLT